jgi:hypothetical protein
VAGEHDAAATCPGGRHLEKKQNAQVFARRPTCRILIVSGCESVDRACVYLLDCSMSMSRTLRSCAGSAEATTQWK